MDPRQRQRLGWIVRFFALLLVLTLLARGTAGAAMASVTVHRPSSGNVTKSVRTTATVSFAGGTPFTVPAGLLVMAVPVQAGQTVKAGDTLAVFDAAEVDRAVNAKRAALQQARTQAAQQTAGDTADPYAAQLAQQQLERAYEETHRIYADGEESVSRAQTKRDEAAAALEKARNAGYADDAEKQAAVENAAAALEAAEDALYSAQKAAEDANNAALSAAQSAEDNRNTALHTLEKEQETTEKQNALDRAAAAVTASDAETLQAELDTLLAVQQAGGTLTAPSDGTLVSLDLVVGQPSPAVGGQLAADADFTAEIPLEESQANLVSVGTVLHLSQTRASCDAAVQSLSAPDENGTVTAKCTLSKGAWCAGAANASATVQGEKRPCVLPASAVHKDNTGCYVLAIEQKATILGQQNIVVSLPVTVVETGDTTAAVSGALDADTQVIVSSTRAVQAGDRVKIHDAS